MKSKISFFNKTIYKKNFALFWPIWVGFLLLQLLKGPAYLWVCYNSSRGDKFECLLQSLNFNRDLTIVFFAALLAGMALFHYLFTSKSANMIHALPVTRLELYGTNVLSGLTFLLVPQFIAFMISVFVSLSNGVAQVQYLGMGLLINWGMSIFFFSFVAFCAMFTGQLFALPVYYIICNVLVECVVSGAGWLVAVMANGVNHRASNPSFFKCFSPFLYMMDEVRAWGEYQIVNNRGTYKLVNIQVSGGRTMLLYVLAAVVLYVLAFRCYQKRDIESAGDLITFNWVKPVFRWGVGVCFGFLSGTLLMHLLEGLIVDMPLWSWFVFVIVIGILFFFLAEMLIQKAFRVLTLRRCRECGLFVCFTAFVFFGIYAFAYRETNYLPDKDKVSFAYLEMNYPIEFEGEEVQQLLDLHQQLIEQSETIQTQVEQSWQQENMTYIHLNYKMDDGTMVSRSYELLSGSEVSEPMISQIYAWEQQGENFLRNYVDYDYQAFKRFTDGEFEWTDPESEEYEYRYLGSTETKKLYEAMLLDVEAGTLQSYNLTDFRLAADDRVNEPSVNLYLNFYRTNGEWHTMYDRIYSTLEENRGPMAAEVLMLDEAVDKSEYMRGSIHISFGENCENIIRTLIECGVISSVEELEYFAE